MVPPWKRTFFPFPFCASLAAFLVDDDVLAMAGRLAAGSPQPLAACDQVGIRPTDRLR